MAEPSIAWTLFLIACCCAGVTVRKRATEHRRRQQVFLLTVPTVIVWCIAAVIGWLGRPGLIPLKLLFLLEPVKATTWLAAYANAWLNLGSAVSAVVFILWTGILWSPFLFIRNEKLPFYPVVFAQAVLIIGTASLSYR